MPDYNPDGERHADKKFIIQDCTRHHLAHVPNSPNLKFDQWGRCMVTDAGLARELQKETPKDITVTRVRRPHHSDRDHVYFFGMWPEMPWKRKKAGEESPQEVQQDADS